MTEADWLAASDPTPMLVFVRDKASDRKLRLFGCGCSRQAWSLQVSQATRAAVDAAEAFADGLLDAASLRAAREAAGGAQDRMALNEIPFNGQAISAARAGPQVRWVEVPAGSRAAPDLSQRFGAANAVNLERNTQAELFRCIFGNPFRPVTLDPSWLTTTVIALAEGIYQDRAFDRLPILADALQDSGCDNEDVLNHCRSDRPHVRGCWVIDLLTGRK